MKGFIVKPSYKVIDGKGYVHLYGKLENGESFQTINEFKHYFQIKKSDLEKTYDLETEGIIFETDNGLKNFDDEKCIKIIVTNPKDIPKLKEIFEKNEIECYEADISFAYRFMMDNQLLSCLDIKGEFEKGDFVDRVYKNPIIKSVNPKDTNFKLKTVSFDIETDGLGQKLFSISIYTKDYQKVIFVNRGQIKKQEFDDTIIAHGEKEALLIFNKIITKLDPDILTGWNVIDFDLAFLYDKYKQHRVKFLIGRSEKEAYVKIDSSFMGISRAYIPGRVVLDGIDLLKNTFYKMQDYKLDTAAEKFLGERKTIGSTNKVKEIEDSYNNTPEKLIKYNLKDSELVYNIFEKIELIELTMHRSLLVGMPLDRVQASVASLDSLYLRELNKIGYVAPTSKLSKKEKGVTGGFVMKSKPGIYDNVIVCDFKSLYPSVMRTFNIDPLAFHRGKKSNDFIEAPNGAKFDKKEGLLPVILARLWKDRDEMKAKKNITGSYAIKIHMNSMYGVLANPSCRFYDYDLANAITTFSRSIIQSAIKLTKEKGFDVIYSDTDSTFINLAEMSIKEAIKIGTEIEGTINKHFNKFVSEKFGRDNILEIEFEKLYTRFMIPYQRGSTEGAKKRYAGLLLKTNSSGQQTEEIDFTGLEFVRRDWTAVSKDFQLSLLNKIFKKEKIDEYIKQFVEDLKNGKFDDKLIYRKALRKSTEEYIKTTPPHVKAARILEEAGKLDSTIIEYVITTKGPEPVKMMKNPIDYEHYINKQIKPLADSVLIFFDKDFDSLIEGVSQSSLFDF